VLAQCDVLLLPDGRATTSDSIARNLGGNGRQYDTAQASGYDQAMRRTFVCSMHGRTLVLDPDT
jgi:hypothetical protein